MVQTLDRRAWGETALSEAQWRLFVSIAVPDGIQKEIEHIQKQLKTAIKCDSVHWTRKNQIHLTLTFLGNVSSEQVQPLKTALAQATEGFSAFKLRAKGLGFFPPKRVPRVIWVGLDGNYDDLLGLQA